MRYTLLSVVLVLGLLVAAPVLADGYRGISTTDIADTWAELNPQERAEMATIIAKKAAAKKTAIANVTVEEVEPWLLVIDRLGSGLVKLAHDMGVEANELITTPVGVLAMGLVVFHVAGDEVIEIFVGLLWFFMTCPFLVLFYFKSVVPVVEYVEVPVKRFGKSAVVVKALRRKMEFGGSFNVEFVFILLVSFNTLITLCIIV